MARTVVGKGPRPVNLERLGRYRIVRPLSKGGMALVFEARRESLAGVSPRVAIKLILPEHKDSDTFQELFINEARLGASMHHQNLVQIQDFDRDGEHFFLVMEYVEGLTLRQAVAECVRHEVDIPMGVIAEIGRQACDGLHYAHQATDERGVHLGLIHRDVKPSNLMLNPHGVIKILDFGISKGNLLSERQGAVRGTWGYMAPEQAHGRGIAANADVFGLATILYEMASRKPLFRKKKPDEIKRLLDDDHAARMAATLPAEYGPLVGVLVRALQRDPAARYSTAADFGRALSALLPDPITARDEVVRYYRSVSAMEQGQPVPAEALSKSNAAASGGLDLPGPAALTGPSQASLVAVDSTSSSGGLPWLGLGIGGLALLLLAGGGVWVGTWLMNGTDPSRGVVLNLDQVDQEPGTLVLPDETIRAGDDASSNGSADADPDTTATPHAGSDDPAPGQASTESGSGGGRPTPATSVGADEIQDAGGSERPVRVAPGAPDGEQAADGTEADGGDAGDAADASAEEPVIVRVDRRKPPEEPASDTPPSDAAGSADAADAADAAADATGDSAADGTPPDPEPVAVGTGWITLSAQPYGLDYDVFIDGKLVRKSGPRAPVVRHELPAGEHFVTISAAGGARKQFEVTIADDEHVRKVWDFERNAWRR